MRGTTLLRNKLVLIAAVLVLPTVMFAMLSATCLRVQLSASDYLLLFIENWLYLSIIPGAAVISRNVVMTAVFLLGTLFLLSLYGVILGAHQRIVGISMEAQHLRASAQLVALAFLPVAAVAIAMSWVARRSIWLTAAGFLLGAGFLVSPGTFWKWNFVDELSKDATTAEIVSDSPGLQWTDVPRFGSNSSRDNTVYSQVTRPGQVTGLTDGWMGKPVHFQSEARFKDGTVWKSEGDSESDAFGVLLPAILPQLGIDISGNQSMAINGITGAWTLFECARNHLRGVSDRRASIRGTGTFQLDQPIILAELPAQAGASAVSGRFNYRINRVDTTRREIHMTLSIRGVALTSLGDGANNLYRTEFLLVNPATKEFTHTSDSGGSTLAGNEWNTIQVTFSIDQPSASTGRVGAKEFLKDARLYILGTRYGGNITLPYEIPEMLLEEKR